MSPHRRPLLSLLALLALLLLAVGVSACGYESDSKHVTEGESVELGEHSDVLDRDTYDAIREPRPAGRLPLGDGTWHQLARQYVWVQLISTGIIALIVLAVVALGGKTNAMFEHTCSTIDAQPADNCQP